MLQAYVAKEAGAIGYMVYDPNSENDDFLFNVYNYGERKVNGKWEYTWDYWYDLHETPLMAISKSSFNILKDTQDKQTVFNAKDKSIVTKDERGLGVHSDNSWDVSSDFIFKGDLATPSFGSVWSFGNDANGNLGLVNMHGTSMSALQISGGVVLVK